MKMIFPETRINRTLGGLANDMNTLVDSLLGAAAESGLQAGSKFSPRMDIYEAEDKYVLALDLPGMKSEDVQIELENDQLVIHGTRQAASENQGDRFHRIERVFGEFRRSLKLPRGVARDEIAADYNDGVLSVFLPKSKESTARKIEIRSQGTVNATSQEQNDPQAVTEDAHQQDS
jgi:HSP20 family protein